MTTKHIVDIDGQPIEYEEPKPKQVIGFYLYARIGYVPVQPQQEGWGHAQHPPEIAGPDPWK